MVLKNKRTIARDTPLAQITLRKYEPPSTNGRELIRKFCLSTGLLQPGDSRDVIVDVLQVLLTKRNWISSNEVEKEVISLRKKNNLALLGIAPSNIRRQLLRLRELFIVEKKNNLYRITENASLEEIFKEKIISFQLESITKRVLEYIKKIDKEFNKN